jgi:hypothetical protein
MAVVINGTSGITGNTGTLISATTIGVGGATPSASGAGITFPATQSASSNANTLDDYEEGTWTPVVGGVSLTGKGRYTKVGRLVSISFANQTGVPATAVNAAVTCVNIPFPVKSGASWDDTAAATVIWNNESTSYPDELACGRLAPNGAISMTNKGSEATTLADPWGMSLVYFTD